MWELSAQIECIVCVEKITTTNHILFEFVNICCLLLFDCLIDGLLKCYQLSIASHWCILISDVLYVNDIDINK